ncbi:MAG: flagellar motor protein PomA [Methylothermaceae bacteria B42]|nr:MAG: flagellar motor protein PomA [Methylothermaceae bacteria B42]HHJ39495.1 flagellar motor protein PomA [Methylothermaceae bacterium]
MDIATLVGFLGGMGIIIAAIMMGGDFGLFVNVPSILIVFGGTFMVTLMKIPLSDFFRSFGVALKAFFNKLEDPAKLIEESVRLADVARKNGLLALENETVENEFLQKGVSLCVDGHDPALIRKMLSQDINMAIKRHEVGQTMWSSVGDMAPAMGMIGTLVGLVQMLANMSDPASIGPAMAVALLTTLYGAVIANAFAIPLADKLALISEYERDTKSLIIETINGIQEGMNPKVLEALLNTYLPEKKRTNGEGD